MLATKKGMLSGEEAEEEDERPDHKILFKNNREKIVEDFRIAMNNFGVGVMTMEKQGAETKTLKEVLEERE